MSRVVGNELVLDRAQGPWLWDTTGRRYLDATSSLWYANIGHGRERIAQAVNDQLRRLDAYSIFNDFTNAPAEQLAARVAAIAPQDDARVFLTTGGGDGIDTAAKLARQYWRAQGQPERTHIIGRTGGFHGAHGFGTSIGGIPANRAEFGPLLPDRSTVAWDSLAALASEVERIGAERVAAIFAEPVVGAGGVLPPPDGYLEGLSQLCSRTGILFVADDVICAFGRLGTWFGTERWGVAPDITVFAKGVTSGYLPLGGVTVSGAIAEPFWSADYGTAFRHGSTYAGHPACCAAALANLDIIEEEQLLASSQALEAPLRDRLAALADHPLVAESRAIGLMGALEMTAEAVAADPAVTLRVHRAAREAGVLVRPLLSAIAVSPPLIVTEDELELMADGIATALDAVALELAA
jgi:adenosylmethionine-8-amino-7-oxononanoate aminotransferase